MTATTKKVAIYTRVSTKKQTTDNQLLELQAWAARAGYTVHKVYEDKGISGSKGREKRPQFDALLKDAVRREFDMIAVWSSDRLGRSMPHLVEMLQIIRDTKVDLYIHTQALDTSTPSGRALFQLLGVFAELEREMIVARVNAGLDRVRDQLERKGKYTVQKTGIIRTRLGRPGAEPEKIEIARKHLSEGMGILKAAKLAGLGTSTVQKLKAQIAVAA
jgi:DNA invertase Pin-like site-specific DNA recombinase